MKIKSIKIHNFRSIKEITFNPYDYSIMLGINNAGKTNVITALRTFYEDIKYTENTDFPKFETDDKESWIEIEYLLTEDEFNNLRKEYQNPGNLLKIRKYLKSEEKAATNQSNLYGYENGKLSDNLFYGWKTKGQSKLGKIIYIPEVTKADETMKLSGPSPLRDIITFVMDKVVKKSSSYSELNIAFDTFNKKFKDEASKDGFSLNKFKEELNESLKEWEVEFNLEINAIQPEDIIKNLITHHTIDKNLDADINVNNLGQGLQRHLIYTMLRLSSHYIEKKEFKKKEFDPELTLILFEEPEAFLHPSQQESLNYSLKSLSSEENQQIIVSTHSPFFVSKNIEDISSLIKLKREKGVTKSYQVSEEAREKILKENNELVQCLKGKLGDTTCPEPTKTKIRQMIEGTDKITKMEEEAIRYLLWLNSERCCAFFADHVLICEGASEKAFIDYLDFVRFNFLINPVNYTTSI